MDRHTEHGPEWVAENPVRPLLPCLLVAVFAQKAEQFPSGWHNSKSNQQVRPSCLAPVFSVCLLQKCAYRGLFWLLLRLQLLYLLPGIESGDTVVRHFVKPVLLIIRAAEQLAGERDSNMPRPGTFVAGAIILAD